MGVVQVIQQDAIFRRGLQIAILFWIICLVLLGALLSKLPPEVPLFYSRPWGEEQLVPTNMLFLLPGIALFIIAINLLVIKFFIEEKLLLRILALISALCSFLVFYDLIQIIIISV